MNRKIYTTDWSGLLCSIFISEFEVVMENSSTNQIRVWYVNINDIPWGRIILVQLFVKPEWKRHVFVEGFYLSRKVFTSPAWSAEGLQETSDVVPDRLITIKVWEELLDMKANWSMRWPLVCQVSWRNLDVKCHKDASISSVIQISWRWIPYGGKRHGVYLALSTI